MNSPLASKQDRILLVPLYHNTGIGNLGGKVTATAPLPGRALWRPGGVSLLQDATPPAEHNATADHLEGDDLTLDLISYQRHANISWCLIPATIHSNKRPWGRQEALTYVFARYAHGSALLHLACLHDDTHHYWVTGVENKLREYFHLAREYCYMPGRQQGGGILKRLLERCGEY